MKRVSIHSSDTAGYAAWQALRAVDQFPVVFLDGEPQGKCFAADEEEGWAEVPTLDAAGRLQLRWDSDSDSRVVMTEIRFGRIHIETRKR